MNVGKKTEEKKKIKAWESWSKLYYLGIASGNKSQMASFFSSFSSMHFSLFTLIFLFFCFLLVFVLPQFSSVISDFLLFIFSLLTLIFFSFFSAHPFFSFSFFFVFRSVCLVPNLWLIFFSLSARYFLSLIFALHHNPFAS